MANRNKVLANFSKKFKTQRRFDDGIEGNGKKRKTDRRLLRQQKWGEKLADNEE